MSTLNENAYKISRHSFFTLGSIVQALVFFKTTHFIIHSTLGCSFILKHVVAIYTSSSYENALKTRRYSCFML